MSKFVYIVHPLTTHGIPEINRQRVNDICKQITIETPDVIIISPIHAFSFFQVTGSQDKVIECCKKLIMRCDEIWFFGEWWKSNGCKKELIHAKQLNIPIVYRTFPDNLIEQLNTSA